MYYMYDPTNPKTLHYANIACEINKVRLQSIRNLFFEQLNRISLQRLDKNDENVFNQCLEDLCNGMSAIKEFVSKKAFKFW